MRVSERYTRGKFRAGNMILPEANVEGTFTLISIPPPCFGVNVIIFSYPQGKE